jgi:hypothetical protein
VHSSGGSHPNVVGIETSWVENDAKHVLLSPSAFEQLLVGKERLSLHQFDAEKIPPTIHGMNIGLADEHGPGVSVLVDA